MSEEMKREPLKIAFIRAHFDPFGGAEKFTSTLMDLLSKQGAEVHIFANKWEQKNSNYIHHKVGCLKSPSFLRQMSFNFTLERALRGNHFDIIQSNEKNRTQHLYRAGDGVHAHWLALRKKEEGVLKRISLTINPFHLYTLYRERKLLGNRDLQAVVVNSEMVRKEIVDYYGFPDERIWTIYNGVDLEYFSAKNKASLGQDLRKEHGVPPRTPIILFVGSGYRRKGLTQIIKALPNVQKTFQLWVVGKDSLAPYRRLVERLNMGDKVVFWGKQRDVRKFYAAADFFVLPTLYDPFPSVSIEAMASGLPIIVTKTCGVAECITDGEEGYVLEDQNDSSLASYLNTLVQNEQMRLMMSQKASLKAAQFSFAQTVEEYIQLYQRLLAERKRS